MKRTFEHCVAPSLDNHTLKKGDIPEDRGTFLVCVEFLTTASFNQRGVCVITTPYPYVSELSKFFNRIQFICFNSKSEENYDPSKPQMPITHIKEPLTKDTIHLIGERKQNVPIFLLALEDSPLHNQDVYTILDPDRSLLMVSDIPEEYISGELFYPIYAPLSCPVAFLSVPYRAVMRIYDKRTFNEELSFFHVVVRSSGVYDSQAETFILTDHACKVLGYQADFCWNAVSYSRDLLPR